MIAGLPRHRRRPARRQWRGSAAPPAPGTGLPRPPGCLGAPALSGRLTVRRRPGGTVVTVPGGHHLGPGGHHLGRDLFTRYAGDSVSEHASATVAAPPGGVMMPVIRDVVQVAYSVIVVVGNAGHRDVTDSHDHDRAGCRWSPMPGPAVRTGPQAAPGPASLPPAASAAAACARRRCPCHGQRCHSGRGLGCCSLTE